MNQYAEDDPRVNASSAQYRKALEETSLLRKYKFYISVFH